MSSLMYEALKNEGKYAISEINTIWAKPLVNGAIAKETMENGILVKLGARDAENENARTATHWDGTGEYYLLQNVAEEGLLKDLGEYDYKNFFIAKDEMVRLIRIEDGVRFETSNYEVESSVPSGSIRDLKVAWDGSKSTVAGTACGKYVVVGADYAGSLPVVGTVADEDTDFGSNAGTKTIRIELIKA